MFRTTRGLVLTSVFGAIVVVGVVGWLTGFWKTLGAQIASFIDSAAGWYVEPWGFGQLATLLVPAAIFVVVLLIMFDR